MNTISTYITLFLILLFGISCNNYGTKTIYYSGTNKVRLERKYTSKDTLFYTYTNYYPNGAIREKGIVEKGVCNGIVDSWWDDGAFCNEVMYRNGRADVGYSGRKRTQYEVDSLKMGKPAKYRIINAYPLGTLYSSGNIKYQQNGDDSSRFSYTGTITPLSGDSVYFYYRNIAEVNINQGTIKEELKALGISSSELETAHLYKIIDTLTVLAAPIYK